MMGGFGHHLAAAHRSDQRHDVVDHLDQPHGCYRITLGIEDTEHGVTMNHQGGDIGDRGGVVALVCPSRLAGEEIPARLREVGDLPQLRPDPRRLDAVARVVGEGQGDGPGGGDRQQVAVAQPAFANALLDRIGQASGEGAVLAPVGAGLFLLRARLDAPGPTARRPEPWRGRRRSRPR
jgi:hypothetical protein